MTHKRQLCEVVQASKSSELSHSKVEQYQKNRTANTVERSEYMSTSIYSSWVNQCSYIKYTKIPLKTVRSEVSKTLEALLVQHDTNLVTKGTVRTPNILVKKKCFPQNRIREVSKNLFTGNVESLDIGQNPMNMSDLPVDTAVYVALQAKLRKDKLVGDEREGPYLGTLGDGVEETDDEDEDDGDSVTEIDPFPSPGRDDQGDEEVIANGDDPWSHQRTERDDDGRRAFPPTTFTHVEGNGLSLRDTRCDIAL